MSNRMTRKDYERLFQKLRDAYSLTGKPLHEQVFEQWLDHIFFDDIHRKSFEMWAKTDSFAALIPTKRAIQIVLGGLHVS